MATSQYFNSQLRSSFKTHAYAEQLNIFTKQEILTQKLKKLHFTKSDTSRYLFVVLYYKKCRSIQINIFSFNLTKIFKFQKKFLRILNLFNC